MLLRRVGRLLLGLVLLVLIAAGTVWLLAERELSRQWPVPLAEFSIPAGDSIVAAGERLARLRGCAGCHGAGLAGQIFDDIPWVVRLPAPNVPARVATYSDPELARTMRHGITREGRALAVMPSSMFHPLSDADLGAILAWVRSLPVAADTLPSRKIRILGRLALVLNQFQMEPELIDHDAPRAMPDTTNPATWGRYLARTSCTECHGLDLQGDGIRTPNLAMVAGYSEEQFRHLIRTGEPTGGRTLGLMAQVARSRFSHFTEAEVGAVHAYLAGRRTGG